MGGLIRLASKLLMLAAAVVVFVMAISDHSADYGRVSFGQQNGAVTLPEGTVKLFFDEGADANGERRFDAPIFVQVTPVGSDTPLPLKGTTPGAEGALNERSSELGAQGSIAEVDVPTGGNYAVALGGSAPLGDAITFGADRFTAIVRNWKLWCGLLAGGVLLALMPVPRRRRPYSEVSPA